MPTLLQINSTANWGSTGKIAEQIGKCAISKGWNSYIAYGRCMNPSQNILIPIGNKLSPYLHFAEQRIFDNEGQCSRIETKRLIQQIKKIKPDIINIHNIHDHYINFKILFRYLNKTDIKIVWTFHDCWAITGHCMHFITKKCDRWMTGCYECPMKGEYPKTILDRSKRNWNLKKRLFSENRNLTIVACSDWMANFVKKSFLSEKCLNVIHNGCDIKLFSQQTRNIKHRYQILAVSSVWYPNKGELDIYKLRSMLPEDQYEIIMVGLSAEQVRKLPIGIKGIQRTQNIQELAQLYSDADVLINPTYEDNFPTVNIESLACGTPVITYRTGGSPEAIDIFTGAVVEQGDLDALCQKIQEFRNESYKEKHSIDCRLRAEKLFDMEKCFERYIDMYSRIVNS